MLGERGKSLDSVGAIAARHESVLLLAGSSQQLSETDVFFTTQTDSTFVERRGE